MYMNGNIVSFPLKRPPGYRVPPRRGIRGLGENKQSQQQSQGQSTTTAVSPTIQQSFTPQISPVFQQSSGGGTQSASTQQIAPGGQSGQGGSATGAPGYMPATPGQTYTGSTATPYTPSYGAGSNLPALTADPFYRNLDYNTLAAQPGAILQKQTNWPLYALGGLIVLAAVYFISTRSDGDRKGVK